MKNFIAYCFLLLLVLGTLGCQAEKHEILTEDDAQAADPEFFQLVEQMSMHDGTEDDSIDESPCFSIRFPFEILLDGIEISIKSASDLQKLVQATGDLSDAEFELEFPISLMLSNYEMLTVGNEEKFEELQEQCESGKLLPQLPITCATPEFPVKVLVYNAQSQQMSSFRIASKQQLYVFLQNRSANELLDFEYPLTLSLSGGAEVTVDSKTAFKQALKNCN